ncbi:MAG: type II toxin-antitoxin system HicA family toxin [Collinsella sp.]
MTRVDKLIAQLFGCPSTYRFADFLKVMASYGFEMDTKGRTSGSRIRFYRPSDGRIFVMHAPHPSDELTAGTIRNIVRFLQDAGDNHE